MDPSLISSETRVKLTPTFPMVAPEIVTQTAKIAQFAALGLAEFLIRHSENSFDKLEAEKIKGPTFTKERCREALQFIQLYSPFIRVVPDVENYYPKGKVNLLAWEKFVEIKTQYIEVEFGPYRLHNRGIKILQNEEQISFYILTISQTAYNAMINYSEACCSIL